jgi:hypothetical protein
MLLIVGWNGSEPCLSRVLLVGVEEHGEGTSAGPSRLMMNFGFWTVFTFYFFYNIFFLTNKLADLISM